MNTPEIFGPNTTNRSTMFNELPARLVGTPYRVGDVEDVYHHPEHHAQSLRAWVAAEELVGPMPDLARCPHGAYGMAFCPAKDGCAGHRVIDHGMWWLPRTGAPFLLAHTYWSAEEAQPVALSLGEHHGLQVEVGNDWDAWYGGSTVPVLLTPISDIGPLPIEAAIIEAHETARTPAQLAAEALA